MMGSLNLGKFKVEVRGNISKMIKIKSKDEITKMVRAAEIVRDLLFELENIIKPGVSTIELDSFAEKFILDQGGIPGFKGLYGFPATLCVSINDEVVHGIPGNRKLLNGDIIGIDVGSIYEGFYGDHAKTFPVGDIDTDKEKLIDVTKECLLRGIREAKPGKRIGDIGYAVQKHAESFGYGVVRELVGHGVGKNLHESPEVPNYGRRGRGAKLQEGLVIAIEPMINMGTRKIMQHNDGWTITTIDNKPSAHFEHTIVVRKGKAEILSSFEEIEKKING